MELISSNVEDIKRYYYQTYVKFQQTGDELFFIHKITSDQVLARNAREDEVVISLNDSVPYDIDFVMPHKSMYQLEKKCFSLTRTPAKQYHRGISTHNCLIKALSSDGWGAVPMGFVSLNGFVNKPMFKPLEECMTTKSISEALSPRFAWSVGGTLWCDWTNIGRVDKKTRKIHINPLLKREMQLLLEQTKMKDYFTFA